MLLKINENKINKPSQPCFPFPVKWQPFAVVAAFASAVAAAVV